MKAIGPCGPVRGGRARVSTSVKVVKRDRVIGVRGLSMCFFHQAFPSGGTSGREGLLGTPAGGCDPMMMAPASSGCRAIMAV